MNAHKVDQWGPENVNVRVVITTRRFDGVQQVSDWRMVRKPLFHVSRLLVWPIDLHKRDFNTDILADSANSLFQTVAQKLLKRSRDEMRAVYTISRSLWSEFVREWIIHFIQAPRQKRQVTKVHKDQQYRNLKTEFYIRPEREICTISGQDKTTWWN